MSQPTDISNSPEQTVEPLVGFNKLLGFRLTERGENFAKAELDLRDEHMNRHGIPHGGVIATMLDMISGQAGSWQPDSAPRLFSITLTYTISYIGQAKGRKLYATAQKSGGGRSIFFAKAQVYDEHDTLVATGEGSFKYRQPKS